MEYHQDKFDDYSLLIFKNDKLVALLPANIKANIVCSHQGLTYGGLVVSRQISFEEVFNVFRVVLHFLDDNNVETLELKIIPSIYNKIPSDEMNYLMIQVNANMTRKDVLSVIDQGNKLPITSSNRKRGLKKAQSKNLLVKEEDDFDAFWNEILIPNLQFTHKVSPVHTLAEITLLKSRFSQNIRQFNVYHNNTIVGGTTIFETEKVAHAQYISANESRQELGTLDLLFNELINNVFKHKAYFDFGISSENQGHQINRGLLSWKESFGARSIVQEFYSISTKNANLLNNLML
jgi:hypothetical protein